MFCLFSTLQKNLVAHEKYFEHRQIYLSLDIHMPEYHMVGLKFKHFYYILSVDKSLFSTF